MSLHSNPERQGNPAPEELNQQLVAIVDHFPKWTEDIYVLSSKKTVKRMEKRKSSEYSQKLLEQIRTLVSFAPTTTFFRDFIMERFENEIEVGVLREEDGSIRDLFFLEPGTGGIFDHERSRRLERLAIKRKEYEIVRAEVVFTKARTAVSGDPTPKVYTESRQKVEKWRETFKKHYNQEA